MDIDYQLIISLFIPRDDVNFYIECLFLFCELEVPARFWSYSFSCKVFTNSLCQFAYLFLQKQFIRKLFGYNVFKNCGLLSGAMLKISAFAHSKHERRKCLDNIHLNHLKSWSRQASLAIPRT